MKAWTRYPCCGFIAACLLVQAGIASAASPPIVLPLEGKDTPPSFKTQPSEQEIWRDYPKLAILMGMTGRVQVTCDVETDASVDHCVADTEIPTGLGFAAAAVHIASSFHLNPATFDGAPVKAKYTTSIRFKIPDQPPPKSVAEPPPPSDAKLALARQLIDLSRYKEAATRTYETAVERANQELEWSGRPTETQAAMDAFRQGVQDALVVTLERKARQAAAQMSEADLDASLAFLKSSAGQAWLTFTQSTDPDEAQDFQSRAMDAARSRYCAKVQCESR